MSKNTFLTLLIAVGLLAALLSFSHRYAAEARNRRVEMVVDWSDAQALANTTRRSIDDVLRQLKTAGITTVAVAEDTLNSLSTSGVVSYKRDAAATMLTFTPGFAAQRERVMAALTRKTRLTAKRSGANGLRVEAPWPQFNGLWIGMDDETIAAVRHTGLLVAPRLNNYTGVTPDSIAWQLAQAKAQAGTDGLGPLIFAGSAVLGNRALIGATADNLTAQNFVYGSVEFGKLLGDDSLARKAAAQTVRVHSIGADEMGTMDEPTAIERFVRAAKERNIRVCYIRLFTSGTAKEADVIKANTEFIAAIGDGLREARFTLGRAHPFEDDPKPGRLLRLTMAGGVAAGVVLLLRVFLALEGAAFWASLGLGLILGAGLAWPESTTKGREILALLAAIAFPTLGLCALPLPQGKMTVGAVLGRAFGTYARMTLATLAGIVFVVGLLSGRLFLLKVDSFLGVKLVLVGPVLLTAAFYGLGLDTLGTANWRARLVHVTTLLRGLFARPLLIGQIVLGLAALVAFALFVARSGNDPGVGVSQAELTVRSLLDKYLLVRPRTKEFLLGHPALFFALAAAWSRRFRRAVVPLLIVGAVGQASLVDTFCHLHTPLFISLLRGFIGWALGGILGALLFMLAVRVTNPPPAPLHPLPTPIPPPAPGGGRRVGSSRRGAGSPQTGASL